MHNSDVLKITTFEAESDLSFSVLGVYMSEIFNTDYSYSLTAINKRHLNPK